MLVSNVDDPDEVIHQAQTLALVSQWSLIAE